MIGISAAFFILTAVAYWYLLLATGLLSTRYYLHIALLLVNGVLGIWLLGILWSEPTFTMLARIVISLIVGILSIYGLGMGLGKLTLFQQYNPRSLRSLSRSLARFTSSVERTKRRTSDGVQIQIVHMIGAKQPLVDGKPRFKENSPRSKVVIVCHGGGRNKDLEATLSTCELLFEDYDVITFDFRGHQESGGWWVGDATSKKDLRMVVDFAREKGYQRIGLVGWSFGAWIAIILAAEDKDVDVVVAAAPPPGEMREVDMLRSLFAWGYKWWAYPWVVLGVRAFRGVLVGKYNEHPSLMSYIANVSPIPLLLVWNEVRDRTIGVKGERFEELFCEAGEPKKKLPLPGVGHIYDWPNTFYFLTAVREFLSAHL